MDTSEGRVRASLKRLKGGEVCYIRFNPRSVMALIDAADAAGAFLPPGTSLSTALSQGVMVAVETLIQMELIKERAGWEYGEMTEKYRRVKSNRAIGLRVREAIDTQQALARAADRGEVPTLRPPTEGEFVFKEGRLGRWLAYYKELRMKAENNLENMSEREKERYILMNDVGEGVRELKELSFRPDGSEKEVVEQSEMVESSRLEELPR